MTKRGFSNAGHSVKLITQSMNEYCVPYHGFYYPLSGSESKEDKVM